MADHGLEIYDNRYPYPERMGKDRTVYFPLLMVKPAGATGPMTIREDLTSSIDVRPLLQNFYTRAQTMPLWNSIWRTCLMSDICTFQKKENWKREAHLET